MSSLLLALLSVSFISSSFAGEREKVSEKDFEKIFDLRRGNKIKVKYLITGEPVIAPSRIEIWALCKGKKERFVEMVRMCDLLKYEFEQDVGVLTLAFSIGRVDSKTGRSRCDGRDELSFRLARQCDKHPGKTRETD